MFYHDNVNASSVKILALSHHPQTKGDGGQWRFCKMSAVNFG